MLIELIKSTALTQLLLKVLNLYPENVTSNPELRDAITRML